MKKIFSAVLCTLLVNFCFAKGEPVNPDFVKPDAPWIGEECIPVTSPDCIKYMRTGWNLGNSLDAHNVDTFVNEPQNTETCWGNPATTEEMIRNLSESGIKTVRIPVSWTPHINGKYKINAKWMARVKQIVDWCRKYNMYVIINIHHDNYYKSSGFTAGKGFYPVPPYEQVNLAFVGSIWQQVAEAFKDYDECVVFETLNEPRMRGDKHEWYFDKNCKICRQCMEQLNKMNQCAVNAIRSAGGFNATRLIMVPSIAASPDAAYETDYFKMPSDSANNLCLSVHLYTPYSFAMQPNSDGGHSKFTESDRKELDKHFNLLKEKYLDKGYGVIIGEYGATNKDNLAERVKWYNYFVGNTYKLGMICVLWDNQVTTTYTGKAGEECYGFYQRGTGKWFFPDITNVIVDSVR